jgi:hypothetical protein
VKFLRHLNEQVMTDPNKAELSYMAHLFMGLSTVFAWAPATVLVLFAGFSLYGGITNIFIVPLDLSISLVVLGLAGIAGYVGVSAICWNLKLSNRYRLVCLATGAVALAYSIWMGMSSGNKLLKMGDDWVNWYLFIGPLIFAVIHIVILLNSIWGSKAAD